MNDKYISTEVDKYLIAHRELKEKEYVLLRSLAQAARRQSSDETLSSALKEVQLQLRALEQNTPVKAREFDVFRSTRDWRIEEFYRNNPEPIRPTCEHSSCEPRKRDTSDKTWHIKLQCLKCGKVVKHLRKETIPNWQDLLEFDDSLQDTFFSAFNSWHDERAEIMKANPAMEGIPHFDHVDFKKEYTQIHPEPLSPGNCKHAHTRLTRRGQSAVEQCEDCGQYIRAVSKGTTKNFDSLPLFIEGMKERLNSEWDAWLSKYSKASRAAENEFLVNRNTAIASGELKITDHTTFGRYYESEEWSRTRGRIFARDNSCCQACKKPAQCVHHLCYNRLGCENDLDLISLCTACHDAIHARQQSYGFPFKLTSTEIRSFWEDS